MKVQEIFDVLIQKGIENDPRGEKEVKEYLASIKKDYEELPEKRKKEFDKEKLTNPYSDSKFHAGDKNKEVKRVLVGIDMGTDEVLLAKELERCGKKIDLIIAHHPVGRALADLHEVMDIQTSVYAKGGVPENVAEGILREEIENVSKRLAPVNHYESPMAAELLGLSMINIHTPADNAVWKFVSEFIEKKNPKRVGELVDALKEIPEYKKATELGAGPVVFSGSESSRLGKVLVSGMTGGTNGKGSEKIYERMSQAGIGTEVAMHVGDEDRLEAVKHYINIVIAGHIASDSLGLNLILDELEEQGIEIVACSGFIRHSRVK